VIVAQDADLPVRIRQIEDRRARAQEIANQGLIEEHRQAQAEAQRAEERRGQAYRALQQAQRDGGDVEAARSRWQAALRARDEAVARRRRLEGPARSQRELKRQIDNYDAEIRTLRQSQGGSGGREEMTIGLAPKNQVSVGLTVGPTRGAGRPPDPVKRRFRSILQKAGFDWSGYDADHVVDLSIGGHDADWNLWPVTVNPSPNQRIDLDSGKQVGVSEWNNKTSGGKKPEQLPGKYFKIFGVKKP
jgi:hypothetical protein